MPRIPQTTDAQSVFLRAFRTPAGPSQWPAPAILRRWLRQPPFLRALNSLLETLRFQSDFQLATAAVNAATQLAAQSAQSPDKANIKPLESILRLAHTRQRFVAIEARHTAVQTLTAELAKSQAELAEVRSKLELAKSELRLSFRLDPYCNQRPTPPFESLANDSQEATSPPAPTEPTDDPTRDALDALDDLDAAANADDAADAANASTKDPASQSPIIPVGTPSSPPMSPSQISGVSSPANTGGNINSNIPAVSEPANRLAAIAPELHQSLSPSPVRWAEAVSNHG